MTPTPPVPTTGTEYLVSNGGTQEPSPKTWSTEPYFWSSTPIGFNPATPLNGFTVGVRPYSEILVPDPIDPLQPGTLVRSYPTYYLVSQTLTVTGPTPPLYTTNTGTELFTASLGEKVGVYSTAGITDGTAYSYPRVFDQTDHDYIERDYIPPKAPPAVDGSVEPNPYFPVEPYNPALDIYPYKSITTFIPDTRDFVVVGYQLTTVYSYTEGGETTSDTINISQTVTQSVNDWSSECNSLVARAAYANGLYQDTTLPS